MRRQLLAFLVFLLCSKFYAQEKIERVNYDLIKKNISEIETTDFQKIYDQYQQVNKNDSLYLDVLISKSYYLIQLKKYKESLEVINEAFKYGDQDVNQKLYINKGVVLRDLEKFDEAISNYSLAIEEYPYNSELYYYRALAYEENNQLKEATNDLYRSIQLEPNYKNSYLQLGLLFYKEQKPSQALMAFNMYLMLDPDGTNAFNILNSLNTSFSRKNDSKPTGVVLTKDDESFEDIDLILSNGIALNSKYKIDNKIGIPLVKQTHVLLEQLNSYKGDGDFWDTRFVEFYKWINDTNQFDEYIYTICFSIENEKYKKLVLKNKGTVIAFLAKAMVKWQDILKCNNKELINDQVLDVDYLYENNKLVAYGQTDENKNKIGDWKVFSENGKKKAEGRFNKSGQKEGEWLWYNETGDLKSSENYIDGEINGAFKSTYDNGNSHFQYSFKEGKLDGNYKEFNEYGLLVEDKNFVKGQQEGKYLSFYNLGSNHKQYSGIYKENMLEGELINYYDSGEIASKSNFVNDLLDGQKEVYYRNGKINIKYFNKEGKTEGIYTRYAKNGNVLEEGNYVNDERQGLWKEYYDDGVLSQEINYLNDELDGSYKVFDIDGKLYYEFIYKKGLIVSGKYFNKEGEVISDLKKKSGGIQYKGYSVLGEPISDGYYNIKGGKDGKWKFFEDGTLTSESTSVDGKVEGEIKWYYKNGQLSSIEEYKNGFIDGYDVGYYSNGQMKDQGYYADGKADGEIVTYHIDGTISDVDFYHKGKKHGVQTQYNVDGKLYAESKYKFDNLISKTYYRPNGDTLEVIDYENYSKEYKIKLKHFNNTTYSSTSYKAGAKHGEYIEYHFNGQLSQKGNYFNNNKNGKWESFDEKGRLSKVGNYYYGDKTGKWETYRKGKLYRIDNYIDDLREGVSTTYTNEGSVLYEKNYKWGNVHGEFKTYSLDGKLQIVRYYHNDKLIGYSYENENKELKPMIKLPVGTGKVKAYFSNGEPSFEAEYKNRQLVGEYKSYSFNGNIYKDYKYDDNNNLNGVSKTYFLDGNLYEEESYLHGFIHGVRKEFFKNGNLKSETNYVNGSENGEAIYYNEKGGVKEKRTYFNGLIVEIKKI